MSFLLIIIFAIIFIYTIHNRLEKDTLLESERLKTLGISHKVVKKWYGLCIEREK